MSFEDEEFEGKLAKRELGVFPKGTYWRLQEGGTARIMITSFNSKTKAMRGIVYDSSEIAKDTWSYWTNGVWQGNEYDEDYSCHLKYPFVQVDSKGKALKKDTKKIKVAEPKIKDLWTL